MKSIIYILLFLIIGSIVLPNVQITEKHKKKTILLESKGHEYDSALFVQSAQIIDFRFKNLGIEEYKMSIVMDQPGIMIDFISDSHLNKAKDVLKHKGELNLVKVIKREDALLILKRLQIEDQFLINAQSKELPVSVLNVYNEAEKNAIEKLIEKNSQIFDKNQIKLAWSHTKDKYDNWQLYVLYTGSSLNINGLVKEAETRPTDYKVHNVYIELNALGGQSLETFTEKNLGNAAAILLDNKVYCAPKIVEPISMGNFIISGNFTKAEANILQTVILSGKLPLDFSMISL